jgi:methionyl-tRNA formyltransferase
MRIIYMGTPDFAVPALRRLIEAGHQVIAVYTQPPRPAGRGQREQPSPVHEEAVRQGIPVRTPVSLRNEPAQREFASLDADVAVVAAYGLILPKAVLAAPRHGCINIHASLLPRWRGAAPIQRAILAGDAESGITIMQMDEGLDTGPILLQAKIPIGPHMTAQELHDALAVLGGDSIVEALRLLSEGKLVATPQPDGATYAAKLTREEGRLDWRRPAVELERQVRAFTPWPGAWFEHAGERFKVLAARVATNDAKAAPGTVLDQALTVACGEGALAITRLQRAGKAAIDAAAFLRGYALPPGTKLA